jgi:hypothetical protein
MPEVHWSKPPRHITVRDGARQQVRKKPKPPKGPCRCPWGAFFCGGAHA